MGKCWATVQRLWVGAVGASGVGLLPDIKNERGDTY